jgi:hypothetical protein
VHTNPWGPATYGKTEKQLLSRAAFVAMRRNKSFQNLVTWAKMSYSLTPYVFFRLVPGMIVPINTKIIVATPTRTIPAIVSMKIQYHLR